MSFVTWILVHALKFILSPIYWFHPNDKNALDRARTSIRIFFRKLLKSPSREMAVPSRESDELALFRDPQFALRSHPNFQTQWWYFSGNLQSSDNRRWEYELVFFIRKTGVDFFGFWPMNKMRDQLFISHFSLVDMDGPKEQKNFRYYHRGGIFSDLHGLATDSRFNIELDHWTAQQAQDGKIHLSAACEGDSIELELTSLKNLIYHGENGYSARDQDSRVASYHCSFTRLETTGILTARDESFRVTGLSWLDHEKMSSHPHRFTWGWDWFSIQLDNNEELMIYRFHNADGTQDNQFSFGTVIDSMGISKHLTVEDFQLKELVYWQSELSGGVYPIHWQIKIFSLDLEIDLRPHFFDCELNCVSTTFVAYWEGPMWITGSKATEYLSGRGYLELCGYDRRLSTKLMQFALTPQDLHS